MDDLLPIGDAPGGENIQDIYPGVVSFGNNLEATVRDLADGRLSNPTSNSSEGMRERNALIEVREAG